MILDSIFLNAFLSRYPSLYISTNNSREVLLKGELLLNHGFKPDNLDQKIYFKEKFLVEITIPKDYPKSLPIIKEVGNFLNNNYPHINYDKTLCLAVESEIRYKLAPNYTLTQWMENFAIPFFYSYCFYSKYHRYPFGERSHGREGIIEYFLEFFDVKKEQDLKECLHIMSRQSYKGHHLCPCGSGKKLRDCHFNFYKTIFEDKNKNILLKELKDCFGGNTFGH